MSKGITQSKEDYLKALLELSSRNKDVHSSDIAQRLGITRASVSKAMKLLKIDGYIFKEEYGTISLTRKGHEIASLIKKRYKLLKVYLVDVLGIQEIIAENDACQMEHVISDETLIKIEKHLQDFYYCD